MDVVIIFAGSVWLQIAVCWSLRLARQRKKTCYNRCVLACATLSLAFSGPVAQGRLFDKQGVPLFSVRTRGQVGEPSAQGLLKPCAQRGKEYAGRSCVLSVRVPAHLSQLNSLRCVEKHVSKAITLQGRRARFRWAVLHTGRVENKGV